MYDVILKAHSCHCVSHKNRSFAGDLVQFISSSVLFSFFVDQITFQKTFDRIIFIFPFKIKLVLKVKCFYFVKIFSHIKHEVVFLFFFLLLYFIVFLLPPLKAEKSFSVKCEEHVALCAIQKWGLPVHLRLLIQPGIVCSSKRGAKSDLAQNFWDRSTVFPSASESAFLLKPVAAAPGWVCWVECGDTVLLLHEDIP